MDIINQRTKFLQYNTIWTPAVFYAVAHSTRIVVTAQSGTDFFNAKNWLRQNGAKEGANKFLI
ncbi:cag pathogenicity island Cag12 family protein [Klebsiella pneumoniae]|uniref:cag pathogenicity island Cag12 family protein n=1 Tax=Klebsiella pneumoniae TaxID=573 RepID=UPI0023046998|nr:cag pathogenicity island Cag12 family protein [Klebsiella pneumoniae]MDA8510286.1 cag pathogenicity island Cag12 family protein [Klebsiella pneumoniae]